MKKQIIFIRGGETFKNQEDFYTFLKSIEIDPYKDRIGWRDNLIEELRDIYESFVPRMPIQQNADYKAWKIWFEKYLKFLTDENPIIVGNSLGATFLLKYLSENNFPKKILQLHLIAPCVTDEGQELEKLDTFEFDITKINKISDICKDIHLWHSKDDSIVPFYNSEIVKKYLPKVRFHILEDRGHFFIESFPELKDIIKKVD